MPYLIIDEYPDYPNTDRYNRVVTERVKGSLNYAMIRPVLERVYPGRELKTPLEHGGPGFIILGVYLSPRKNGVGRIVCNFEMWAVSK